MSEAPDDADEFGPEYCGYTEYDHGVDPEELPATGENATGIEPRVWEELYEVEDPEMPVSVVDLGLIYGVSVEDGQAKVTMTLTYTGCPARSMLQDDVVEAAERAAGVDSAEVELVWSPEWNLNLVTEAGKESLRDFGVSI
ncbi:metal-sulfur cluster assembly factor [Natronomonas salina]|uniref:1,2-phenylacetyl-CoA epoxidase subunit PaaD n=1 Tax=Natronomonas salina TaxID=1710540 RepID=UPI0015B5DF5A|nr:1,2-phenylacetyl-CoA epoxidase subunit PaaD [Natronomonas salina]QLD88213.1 metal-sulfur cluster assembly factor [Natronomonas salina]